MFVDCIFSPENKAKRSTFVTRHPFLLNRFLSGDGAQIMAMLLKWFVLANGLDCLCRSK